MTQPNLPFDIEWLTDNERDYAFRLLNDLVTLCRDRDHVPNALTVERIRLIILTDATANRLEARLAAQLDQPSQRVSGAQVNATTIARHRHARALDDFEAAYPEPAPEPAKPEPAKQENRPYGVSNDYRERVAEVMERMAPELEPFEDPVVTAYFMEKEWGRKFHYELPKEAYTDIIRKPNIGGPIDPITREPMILMQYRARQAKWDEIRRQKAEAKAKEEAEAQEEEEAQPQQESPTTPQPDDIIPNATHDPSDPSDPSNLPTCRAVAAPAKADSSHHSHSSRIPSPPIGVHLSRRSPAKADRCESVAKKSPAPDPAPAAPPPRLRPWQRPPGQPPQKNPHPAD